jgi:hypothetical protein
MKKLKINDLIESQKRVRHQIEHIFISAEFENQIKNVQFLEYPSKYDTDHQPMQLTLDLRDCIPELSQYTFRYSQNIRSRNIKLMRKYVEQRIKLHKHYRIKEKVPNIHNALNNLKDGNYAATRQIQKLIQELDQQNTTICLESENALPRPRITYCSRNIKQILSKKCQLRLEIRICKKHDNLDNLKLLIKKRKNLYQ